MKLSKFKRSMISALLCALLLCGCSSLKLPPLPTPTTETPQPQVEIAVPTPAPETAPEPAPELAPEPTPEPTPVPTPEPTENPDKPHLSITNATVPEDMKQYGVASLLGEVQTDKGLIVKISGQILDADGNIVQDFTNYPYVNFYSLAGTVNAALRFGLLAPGDYVYRLTAIAENNSFSDEQVLVEKSFTVFPA